MSKDIKTVNHGTGMIDIDPAPVAKHVVQGMPTELHLKENGTLSNGPSLAIVIETHNRRVIGQISIDMFNEALNELGYKIIPV